ncbi:MAG: ArsR family transcriptional regulator [Caldilinea sp. CFX5]|nr:ArsR family transcriptional regulator [Caldilinea sp. CFX5]
MAKPKQVEPLLPTEEGPPTPQAEFVIQDIETLRAISDPLRIRLLELMAQPQTVKEIASQLGVGKTKLYYHLNLLEKHGIIRVVRTRVVSGIIEKSYQVTAFSYRPAKELLLPGAEGAQQGIAIVESILDATRADLSHGLKTGQLALGKEAQERQLLLGRVVMSLTPEQATSFYERFAALLTEVSQYEKPATGGQTYSLTVAFFPKSAEQ